MGLNRMVAKGTMERLFQQFVAPLLAPLNLSRRRVIELRNPLLPASAPVNRRELWWRP
jgi:hypothetical protein